MGSAGTFGDSLTGGGKSAQKANKKNLARIQRMFLGGKNAPFGGLGIVGHGAGLYGDALKAIEGVGDASRNQALSREKQYVAGATQNLANMGLSGSTAMNAAQRGIHSDTLRQLGLINEDVARMRANLFTGQAGFQQGNIQSLASILGGTQYQPGTNYALELAKIGASAGMFSDIRLKDIIRLVRTASWNGIEFPVVRFSYKDNPDVEFEGVIAQDVRHIPGVVTRGPHGWLMVDVEALKRKTGVEVRRIESEVSV